MARLKTHLEARGLAPQRLHIRGDFVPQYLTVSIDYSREIWGALDDWVMSGDTAPGELDLDDALDRMGATALIVRGHEMSHFFSFACNPFATSIQYLSSAANSCLAAIIDVLRGEGAERLLPPLHRWREHYKLRPEAVHRIEQFEARYLTVQAVLGRIMFRPVALPTADASWHEAAWNLGRWPTLCRDIAFETPSEPVLTALDLHEGYSVTAEAIALGMHAHLDFAAYYRLRNHLPGTYAILPKIIFQEFGEWDDLSASILISCSLNFPAVAVIRSIKECQAYDVASCFSRVLATMKNLGNVNDWSKRPDGLADYIREIFDRTFPGFDPATLLDPASRALIERSFGIDKEFMVAMKPLVTAAAYLTDLQETVRTTTEKLWWRRFIALPIENAWPPLIGFTDGIERFCEPELYYQTRSMILTHTIYQSLWDVEDLGDCMRWCFGGLHFGDQSIASGRQGVLDFMVRNATTYGISQLGPVAV